MGLVSCGDHLTSVSRACSDFTVEVPVGSTLEALFVNNTQRVPRPQSSTPFYRCLLFEGDRESGSGHASREPGSVKLGSRAPQRKAVGFSDGRIERVPHGRGWGAGTAAKSTCSCTDWGVVASSHMAAHSHL